MKLAVIISAWADTKELLQACVNNFRPVVDEVILVYSTVSNRGNVDRSIMDIAEEDKLPCRWVKYEPDLGLSCHENETRKRNAGLNLAKVLNCTHFLIADADEFYFQDSFLQEKARMERNNLNGLVCPLKVYVGKPTLRCDDHTLVPFIHRLHPETQVGAFKTYPFAYDEEGHAHIDPTRRINIYSRVEMSSIYMHHFSYVRKDINMKIENSSARLENSRSVILEEMKEAKPGYVSKLYHQPLEEVPNYFNIEL